MQIAHPFRLRAHQCHAWDHKGGREDSLKQTGTRRQRKVTSGRRRAMRTNRMSKMTAYARRMKSINQQAEGHNNNATIWYIESNTTHIHGT